MLRLTREHAIQNLSRLFFSHIGLVLRHHSGGDQRQRIKDAGFAVRRMAPVKLFHRIAVSESARPMIEFVGSL